jgi:hypothetical protein
MFSTAFSKMLRILYRNEFLTDNNSENKVKTDSENIDLDSISVLFPAPITLNLTNVNDQISNSSQTLDFITSIYIDENDTDTVKKSDFRKRVVRELLPNIDWDKMDKIYEESVIDATGDKLKNNDESEMGDIDGGEEGNLGF